MKRIERHHTLDKKDAAQILSYIENDLLPLMLEGFAQKPHSMLGASLGHLLNAINCAVLLERSPPEIWHYLELFKTVAICHFRFGSGAAPFTATINGTTLHFVPEAHSEYMYLDNWVTATDACILLGDRESLSFLTTLTEDDFSNDNYTKQENHFNREYYQFIRTFLNNQQNSKNFLTAAIAAAIQPQDNPLRTKFVNLICYPQLRLLQKLIAGDVQAFNEQLYLALTAHQQFWTQETHIYNPKGWISLKLLATCAIAIKSQNFTIKVESDYIPPFLANCRRG